MNPRTKTYLLMATIVLLNCGPWLSFRLLGSPWIWPRFLDIYWAPDYVYFDDENFPGNIPYYGEAYRELARSQIILFSIWTAFSRKALSWRWCYLLGFLCLLTRALMSKPVLLSWIEAKDVALKYRLIEALCITASLWICRLLGLQLRDPSPVATAAEESAPAALRQYSLRGIMWSMAGMGVFLAMWRYLIGDRETRDWLENWPAQLGPYLSEAALTGACLWLVFGRRWIWLRLAVLCLALVVVSEWLYQPSDATSPPFWFFPRFVLSFPPIEFSRWVPVTLWLVGNLYLFRAAGCRMEWQPTWYWTSLARWTAQLPRFRLNRG